MRRERERENGRDIAGEREGEIKSGKGERERERRTDRVESGGE